MSTSTDVIDMLKGGHAGQLGRAAEVKALVTATPELFDEVMRAISSTDKVVASRASHIVLNLAKEDKCWLEGYKQTVIQLLDSTNGFARMHSLELVSFFDYDDSELGTLLGLIDKVLFSTSNNFTNVSALQARVNLTVKNPWLKDETVGIIEEEMQKGRAAIKARGRKLLKLLRKL